MFGFFYCAYNIILMILLSFIILVIFEIKTIMNNLYKTLGLEEGASQAVIGEKLS